MSLQDIPQSAYKSSSILQTTDELSDEAVMAQLVFEDQCKTVGLLHSTCMQN